MYRLQWSWVLIPIREVSLFQRVVLSDIMGSELTVPNPIPRS